MTAPLYAIGTMPWKYDPGAKSLLDNSLTELDWMTLDDALGKQYTTDAHFVTYMVWENPGDGSDGGQAISPRLNKTVLSKIRLAGNEVYNTILVLDYDLPDHKNTRWSTELKAQFWNQLQAVADEFPDAWKWHCIYFTRGGARLIYTLKQPIPCDLFETKHLWMCQEFCRRGLQIDTEVSDWTRLFRLPSVTRDKKPTWEEDYFEILVQENAEPIEAHLYPEGIKIKKTKEYGEIEDLSDLPMPDFDYCRKLCEFYSDHGAPLQTDWFKHAKRRLKNRDCFDTLFTHHQLASIGKRNATLYRFVGQAISMLIQLEGTTMEHIFGLFLPAVEQLEPDQETPDWHIVCWDHICRLWAQEKAAVVKVEVLAEQKSEGQRGLFEQIIHGMRGWCKHPELHHTDDARVFAYARRRMIVSCGKTYYIMGPNGYYDPMPLLDRQIIPRIRILGLDDILETSVFNADGSARDVNINELLNMYSFAVKEIRGAPEREGAYIERMDESTAALVVPSYRRNPHLEPKYSAEVDTWLQKFFGNNYEKGTHWISWALAWDEGIICALSLEGRAGSGKQLFVQALAECLEVPATATAADLTSDYQYGLLESPFLAVNEGWPITKKQMHPADSFRAVVGGDPILINRRFLHPIVVRNPVRVIFTANNLDVVKMLSSNRDLSPEDRDALSIRLMHLRIGDEASDWLRIRGGVNFTGKPGQRWIAGTAGEPSDYVVARHFLWLHSKRKGPCGSRLLVEGNADQEVMFDMQTQSGASPLVIESVIHLLEEKRVHDGVHILDSELYMTAAEILSYFRANKAKDCGDKMNLQQVAKVLKGISKKCPQNSFMLKNKERSGRKNWYQLDCPMLLKAAERDGWSSPKLAALCHEQDLRKRGIYVEPLKTDQESTPGPEKRIVSFGFSSKIAKPKDNSEQQAIG